MSPLKTSLIAALLSIAVTAGGLRYFHQARVREARRLQQQNNQMRADASQRHQARVAAAPTLSVAKIAASPAAAAVLPVQKPAEYYRDEGNATPLATLQTFAWACDRGDTERVGKLLYIDAAARPKAEAFMAALPENARAQWRTVDEMAAGILTRAVMASPFPDAEILATATIEPINDDRVRLRLPDTPKDRTEYQKTASGWKYVLTEAVVDNYLKRAGARSPETR